MISRFENFLVPVFESRSFSTAFLLRIDSSSLRSASLTTWVQTLLIFLQPFHSEQKKKEQIYTEFLHDIFGQIESEKILSK